MRALVLLLVLNWLSAAPAVIAADQISFNADRAWEHLLAQCAFGPRVPGSQGHENCLRYLERSLRETSSDLTLQSFRAKPTGAPDTVRLTNLSARFGPTGRPVLLGAHWDTRPWADCDPDSANHSVPILGANDGASGVAVLLTLAEIFAAAPPPIPVEVALFDCEDHGIAGDPLSWCLGSRRFAESLVPPFPRAVIIVDIVGGKDLLICRESISEEYSGWLNDLIFETAQAMGLWGFENRVCYTTYDDHVPFLEAGLPAVDLVDMHYPQWHTLQDVPEACSKESLEEVGSLLIEILYGGALQ